MNLPYHHYSNKIVTYFMWAAICWAIFGMSAGLYAASEMVWPWLNLDTPWLTFGRIRVIHTNAIVFGFGGSMLIGTSFYIVQRVCSAKLFAPKLAWFVFAGWQVGLLLGMATIAMGINTGLEYAEFEWPLDIAIAIVWVAFAVVFFGTIVLRSEKQLYVGLWYYSAFIIVVAILHIINSLAIPVSLTKSYPIYNGAVGAVVQWWYGHNAVGFFLTGGFIGMLLYFLPKITGFPLWSYRLSILSFWAFVYTYIWAGPHHLHYSSIPDWIQSLGMAMSLILLLPSWGTMLNGLMSINGAWQRLHKDIPLTFIAYSLIFYGLATFEGPLLAIKTVNAIGHNTEWIISHVHSGALGWNAFISFGVLYYLIPKLTGRELYSLKMAKTHFYLALLGILLYIVPLWIAGITQGVRSLEFDEAGISSYSFIDILNSVKVFYLIRFFGGVFFFSGVLLMAMNLYLTCSRGGKNNI